MIVTPRRSDPKAELIRRAANFRHGIVLPPQSVKRTLAEPRGFMNIAIPEHSDEPWKTASGGIGRTALDAELAAIGEALERYAASVFPLPLRGREELARRTVLELAEFSLYSDAQRLSPNFPYHDLYDDEVAYTNAYSLVDNEEVWVPAMLVGLASSASVTTSSGLAAAASKQEALLRALQELIERDALMVTWLHGVPGRRVALPHTYSEPVAELGGHAVCVDATPDYSPHPVALVCGQLPLRGRPRYSLGAACRETWETAVEKAYLEWLQGVVFAGYYLAYHPDTRFDDASQVMTFDDHAVYYTVHPDAWARLPLLAGETRPPPAPEPVACRTAEIVAGLVAALAGCGISLYYRDLTTRDLRQLGVAVVRALSPALAPLTCDQRWPFLGGTVRDVAARYSWGVCLDLCFPNPFPHPLG
jgi:ribosomal protein S12 methylthiotransferase accessory factor